MIGCANARQWLTLLAIVIALSGCGNQLEVSYSCSPDGATLYQANGQVLGECPVNAQYPITAADRSRGYATLQGVTAKWSSGAATSISNITAYLRNGTSQTFHFDRPTDAPNAAMDAQYAAEFEQRRRLQQQVKDQGEAQEQDDVAALLLCGLASFRTRQPLTTNVQCQAAYLRGSTADSGGEITRRCAETGQAFDAKSGNSYFCTKTYDSELVTGFNSRTGSRWSTYYSPNGDMRGTDAEGSSWHYTAASSEYYNYGSGQRCIGVGAMRTCTP
jgi:hypothetical protein